MKTHDNFSDDNSIEAGSDQTINIEEIQLPNRVASNAGEDKPARNNEKIVPKWAYWFAVVFIIAIGIAVSLRTDFFSKAGSYVSRPDFHTNFFANVASDLILGFVLFWLITQPQEKKAQNERIKGILALLKAEVKKNLHRAENYSRVIGNEKFEISTLFPLRYTRGTWNTFKESGFILYIDDQELIQHLLEMNEATYTANRNIRRYHLALIGESVGKDLPELAETAREDAIRMVRILKKTLQVFENQDLPEIELSEDFDYFALSKD